MPMLQQGDNFNSYYKTHLTKQQNNIKYAKNQRQTYQAGRGVNWMMSVAEEKLFI